MQKRETVYCHLETKERTIQQNTLHNAQGKSAIKRSDEQCHISLIFCRRGADVIINKCHVIKVSADKTCNEIAIDDEVGWHIEAMIEKTAPSDVRSAMEIPEFRKAIDEELKTIN